MAVADKILRKSDVYFAIKVSKDRWEGWMGDIHFQMIFDLAVKVSNKRNPYSASFETRIARFASPHYPSPRHLRNSGS